MKNITRNLFALAALGTLALAQAALWERTMEGYLLEDETDEFSVRLTRGEYTLDLVGKNSRGDLDAYVYDNQDNLIVSDELDDNNPICSFRVLRSGTFTIEVYNYGAAQAYEGSIYREE
jgi:hypothetical protein